MNVLFWNLKNNSNEKLIATCIAEKEIDVAIFTEFNNTNFKDVINALSGHYIHYSGIVDRNKITIISSESYNVTILQEQENRYTIYSINSLLESFILVGVHLQDRRNYPDPEDRCKTIQLMKSDIEEYEKKMDTANTIVIGDFNAGPYDKELISVYGFNAVLFKDIIEKREYRMRDKVIYRMFYNPILNFISEDNKMYGSFYDNSQASSPIWHCLDQVIVRKPLVDKIIDVCYLRKIMTTDLISDIKPNSAISDHLPLLVRFSLICGGEI